MGRVTSERARDAHISAMYMGIHTGDISHQQFSEYMADEYSRGWYEATLSWTNKPAVELAAEVATQYAADLDEINISVQRVSYLWSEEKFEQAIQALGYVLNRIMDMRESLIRSVTEASDGNPGTPQADR